jgi:hypothetical protein
MIASRNLPGIPCAAAIASVFVGPELTEARCTVARTA